MSHSIQRASIAAWNDEAHVRDNRRLYAAKYAQVLPLLEKTPLKAERPAGSFYLWIRTPGDDTTFARELHRQYNVLVLPGSFLARDAHGENPGKNHVRIALVAPLEECVEAAGRIAEFTKQ
jgi:N-succinyldiaminopimelate aminotransferase